MPCSVCIAGLHLTERQGLERCMSSVPQCLVRLGELDMLIERAPLVRSSSACGGQRHRVSQIVGGRTTYVPGHTGVRHACVSAWMAMSACRACSRLCAPLKLMR
jgi:hypothetical protein